MTAITIDKDKAIELLEKQVEKKGEDYVYPFANCVYFAPGDMMNTAGERVEEGTPLCIVGNVYADLGLTVDDLYFYDCDGTSTASQDGVVGENLPDESKVVLTEGAILVLKAAQVEQDAHETWGHALEVAKAEVAK